MLSRRSSSWIRSIRQTADVIFKPTLPPHTSRLPVTAGGRVPRCQHIFHHVGIRVFNKAAQTRARRQAGGGQKGHRQQRLSTSAETWRPRHPGHNHKLAFVSYGGVQFSAGTAGRLLAEFSFSSMLPRTRLLCEHQESHQCLRTILSQPSLTVASYLDIRWANVEHWTECIRSNSMDVGH